MSALVEAIGAMSAAMVPAGGGIAFLWNKIEARFKKLEDEQAATEQHLEACRRGGALKLTAIELLYLELRNVTPTSWVLDKVNELLTEAKQIEDADQGRKHP